MTSRVARNLQYGQGSCYGGLGPKKVFTQTCYDFCIKILVSTKKKGLHLELGFTEHDQQR